jgi:WD40 repeat protein
VERGDKDQTTAAANAFLQTWGPDHAEHYPLELRSLTSVQGKQQLRANDFCRRALAEKFVVRLCATSYRLLMAFLSDHHLLPLMEILNERVKVLIEERPPRERFEVVTFDRDGVAGQAMAPRSPTRGGGAGGGGGGGGGGGAGGGPISLYWQPVRWRVSAPPPGENQHLTVPLNCPFNTNLVHKLLSRPQGFLHGDGAAFYPEPGQEGVPAVADPTSPTALMASVANTYGGLTAARFTDDATQLATGYQDRAVRVFRLVEAAGFTGVGGGGGASASASAGAADGGGPMVLRGHSETVHALSWSPEKQFLLSGSADGTARLWDVACGRNLVVYRTPTEFPVWDVAYAPLGHFFLTGSYDRVARIWCTSRTQPVRMLAGHYSDVSCVAWHPNCNYAVTGSWDKTARLWDVQTGRCLRIYAGHFGPMTALAVSPTGQYIAGAGGGASSSSSSSSGAGAGACGARSGGGGGGVNGVIRIWEIATGKEVAVLSGHKGAVHRLAFSPDGVLASAGADETVRTWDVNGDLAAVASSIAIHPHATLRTKGTPVFDVSYTARNLLLACGPAP